jgi:hypothetical protein
MMRHPLIQIPIDLAAIVAWFVVVLGIPAAAVGSIIILVFMR